MLKRRVRAYIHDLVEGQVDAMSKRGFQDGLAAPVRNMTLRMPALDGAGGHAQLRSHRSDAAELLEYALHYEWHPVSVRYAHHNGAIDVRQSHFAHVSESRTTLVMDSGAIIEALRRLGVPHDRIAAAIHRDRSAATKMLSGRRSVKVGEVGPLQSLIAEFETDRGESTAIRRAVPLIDQFGEALLEDYVAVEVLPTYAGMGGGGSGEGEKKLTLLPRHLVEDELGAKPDDLIVIPVRGDSMEPDFFQGDQVLADKRDKNPAQAGPFALWDGDAFVLKNVERLPRGGRLRVFSSNPRYREFEFDPGEVQIVGRPVWFARRV